MKLKRKPTRPKRKTITDSFGSIDLDGKSLEGIEDTIRAQVANQFQRYFELNGLTIDDYSEIRLKESHDYDGYAEIDIYGTRSETDTEFAKRVATYEKSIAKYNAWAEENKDAIAAELQRREDEAKAKFAERQTNEIAALERKLKRLRKC